MGVNFDEFPHSPPSVFVVRPANRVLVVGLVAAVEERKSSLFAEEEFEEVGRVVCRDRVGLIGRVVSEARL